MENSSSIDYVITNLCKEQASWVKIFVLTDFYNAFQIMDGKIVLPSYYQKGHGLYQTILRGALTKVILLPLRTRVELSLDFVFVAWPTLRRPSAHNSALEFIPDSTH